MISVPCGGGLSAMATAAGPKAATETTAEVTRTLPRRRDTSRPPTSHSFGLEHLGAEADAEVGKLLGKARSHAGGLEMTTEPALVVDAHAVVEQEHVLQRDHVALHALYFGDVGDPAGAVTKSLQLHDEIDGRGHLLTNRTHRKVEA